MKKNCCWCQLLSTWLRQLGVIDQGGRCFLRLWWICACWKMFPAETNLFKNIDKPNTYQNPTRSLCAATCRSQGCFISSGCIFWWCVDAEHRPNWCFQAKSILVKLDIKSLEWNSASITSFTRLPFDFRKLYGSNLAPLWRECGKYQ